ncbi:MAG TPA: hypothetical protein VFJ90_09470 [Candidatus Didemnitutus sp.]|nr:hypothetical protein [Candidatus Didemnitutus sp.]
MLTFLPVIHHELASLFSSPAAAEVTPPASVSTPSWPAPAREEEQVYEGKFCVVRVARGFARQGFLPAAKTKRATEPATPSAQAALFDMNAREWPAPGQPAPAELKLPRRAAAHAESSSARPAEVPSLPC